MTPDRFAVQRLATGEYATLYGNAICWHREPARAMAFPTQREAGDMIAVLCTPGLVIARLPTLQRLLI